MANRKREYRSREYKVDTGSEKFTMVDDMNKMADEKWKVIQVLNISTSIASVNLMVIFEREKEV